MASPAKPWDRALPADAFPPAPSTGLSQHHGESGITPALTTQTAYGGFVRPSPFYGGGSYGGGFVGFPPDTGGGFLSPQLAMLSSLHYTVGSVGAIAELIGVNAEALLNAVKSALALVERVGQASGEVLGFLRVRPPVDPATGLPVVSPEQYAVQRRQRLVRWVIGAAVVLVTLALLREGVRGGGATGRSNGIGEGGRTFGSRVRAALALVALVGGAHAGHKLALAVVRQEPPQAADAVPLSGLL